VVGQLGCCVNAWSRKHKRWLASGQCVNHVNLILCGTYMVCTYTYHKYKHNGSQIDDEEEANDHGH